MGDGGAGIGEHAHVVVADPDPVGADEVRPEHAVLGEARDDRSAMAAPALDHLDLGLGEVRVDADSVLAREPDEAVEQLVGGLVRDGRRRGDAHAALGRAVPALDQPRGEVEQALRGGRRDVLDGPSQIRRQQIEQARHGLVEDDVGDRRGQDDARADVAVRAGHRLERLVGDGGQGDEEIVRRGAAGLEHLDGADGRRQVLVLRRAERVVRRGMGQQILERPVPGTAAHEVAPGMGVGVGEAGEHDVVIGVDHARALGRGERRAHRGDAVAVNEHVGVRERRRRSAQDPAAANEE